MIGRAMVLILATTMPAGLLGCRADPPPRAVDGLTGGSRAGASDQRADPGEESGAQLTGGESRDRSASEPEPSVLSKWLGRFGRPKQIPLPRTDLSPNGGFHDRSPAESQPAEVEQGG